MATSGTYAFDPTVQVFTDEAFERVGMDPSALVVRHVRSARQSMNFMLSEWAAKTGVRQWAIEQQTISMVASTPTYNLPAGTVEVLWCTVRRDSVDTPVWPMNHEEYRMLPNKTDEGLPSRYFVDKQAGTRTITFWNVPENSTDVVYYDRLRRFQDVGVPSNTVDLTFEWFEAFASGLAAKLALKFNPGKLQILKAEAEQAFAIARMGDRERGDFSISMGPR